MAALTSIQNQEQDKTVVSRFKSVDSMGTDVTKEDWIDTITIEPLKSFARKAIPLEYDASSLSPATVRIDQLELDVRSYLMELLLSLYYITTGSSNPIDTTTSTSQTATGSNCNDVTIDTICEYWKSCVDLCIHLVYRSGARKEDARYQHMTVRKLPFLVLEDIVDGLSLSDVQYVWEFAVEPYFLELQQQQQQSNNKSTRGGIFSPIIWNQSNVAQLGLLKVCNKFLRHCRQSPANITSTTTISSVENLDIEKNTCKETDQMEVEDSKNINSNLPSPSISNNKEHDDGMILEGEWAGRIIWKTLSKGFGIADKSAMRVWGSFHKDNVTSYDTMQDFDAASADGSIASPFVDTNQHNNNNTTKLDYSLYEAFWSLQTDFSNPNRIQVAEFLKKLQMVMSALESSSSYSSSNGISNSTSSVHPSHPNSSDTTTIAGEATTSQAIPMNTPKYLTSSSLLSTQLASSRIRIPFLTQFLIVAMHLSRESPPLSKHLQSLQQRASTLLTKEESTTTPMHHSTNAILQNTILQREFQWRKWKRFSKCDPKQFEPKYKTSVRTTKGQLELAPSLSGGGAVDGAGGTPGAKQQVIGKKRPRLMDGPLLGGSRYDDDDNNNKKNSKDANSFEFIDPDELARISKEMVTSHVPTLTDHLEPYAEALDPEAGIEPEYYPTNSDPMFSWRAMRLFTKHPTGIQLLKLAKGKATDLERMTRQFYKMEQNKIIPGPEPDEEEDAKSEEGNENGDAEEKDEDEQEDDRCGQDDHLDDKDKKEEMEGEIKDDEHGGDDDHISNRMREDVDSSDDDNYRDKMEDTGEEKSNNMDVEQKDEGEGTHDDDYETARTCEIESKEDAVNSSTEKTDLHPEYNNDNPDQDEMRNDDSSAGRSDLKNEVEKPEPESTEKDSGYFSGIKTSTEEEPQDDEGVVEEANEAAASDDGGKDEDIHPSSKDRPRGKRGAGEHKWNQNRRSQGSGSVAHHGDVKDGGGNNAGGRSGGGRPQQIQSSRERQTQPPWQQRRETEEPYHNSSAGQSRAPPAQNPHHKPNDQNPHDRSGHDEHHRGRGGGGGRRQFTPKQGGGRQGGNDDHHRRGGPPAREERHRDRPGGERRGGGGGRDDHREHSRWRHHPR